MAGLVARLDRQNQYIQEPLSIHSQSVQAEASSRHERDLASNPRTNATTDGNSCPATANSTSSPGTQSTSMNIDTDETMRDAPVPSPARVSSPVSSTPPVLPTLPANSAPPATSSRQFHTPPNTPAGVLRNLKIAKKRRTVRGSTPYNRHLVPSAEDSSIETERAEGVPAWQTPLANLREDQRELALPVVESVRILLDEHASSRPQIQHTNTKKRYKALKKTSAQLEDLTERNTIIVSFTFAIIELD